MPLPPIHPDVSKRFLIPSYRIYKSVVSLKKKLSPTSGLGSIYSDLPSISLTQKRLLLHINSTFRDSFTMEQLWTGGFWAW